MMITLILCTYRCNVGVSYQALKSFGYITRSWQNSHICTYKALIISIYIPKRHSSTSYKSWLLKKNQELKSLWMNWKSLTAFCIRSVTRTDGEMRGLGCDVTPAEAVWLCLFSRAALRRPWTRAVMTALPEVVSTTAHRGKGLGLVVRKAARDLRRVGR